MRELDRGENDVKDSLLRLKMHCVCAAEFIICSTGVSGFQTFKLALCVYNKLRSELLTSLFPGFNPLRSNRSVLNVSNGGWWNIKLTLKFNGLCIKIEAQKLASQVLSKDPSNLTQKKKKRKCFFLSQGHFKRLLSAVFMSIELFGFSPVILWLYQQGLLVSSRTGKLSLLCSPIALPRSLGIGLFKLLEIDMHKW